MAFTINNFWGAETGGIEELYSASAASAVSGGHTGGYCYQWTTSGGNGIFSNFESVSDQGNGYCFGFWLNVSDATPASNWEFFRCVNDLNGSYRNIGLRLNTGGTVSVIDTTNAAVITSSATLSDSAWHYLEVYFTAADSGVAELFIDGSSAGTATATDFLSPNGTSIANGLFFTNDSSGTITSKLDDIYFASGATSASDRFGGSEVIAYRSTLTSGYDAPWSASAFGGLSTGTWANIQEIPFSETNEGSYSGDGPNSQGIGGGCDTDDLGGSSTGGPNGDSNITGTVEAIKGIWRLKRSNGSGTTHTTGLGHSGLTYIGNGLATDRTLTVAYANYFAASESFSPSTSQYGTIGFRKSAGGRDIFCSDMLAQVLHVPSAAAGSLIFNPVHRLMPHLVR